MIRIALCDDQALVREGLRRLLEIADGVEVVVEATCGEELLDELAKADVDVLLLDVRMPGLSGIEVLEKLPAIKPDARAIILTTFPDEDALLAALRAGAAGYLLKDATLDELLESIQAVARGETAVRPVTVSKILPGLDRVRTQAEPPDGTGIDPLTAREKEILRLLAGGYSNKEIAAALGNAAGTVKNHVSNILLKMGVRDRTQAVLKGIEHGLL